jgi:hypothetical protein
MNLKFLIAFVLVTTTCTVLGLATSKPPYDNQIIGGEGLGKTIHIYNNQYQAGSDSKSSLPTKALFAPDGKHSFHSWSSDDDRKWRSTTQAPYFANKIPGSGKKLPAAAVLGAVTAFGLVSLLPLNVPANKPLMYCDDTGIAQSPIKIGSRIHTCLKGKFETFFTLEKATRLCTCLDQTVDCGYGGHLNDVYCSGQTLFSKLPLVCNSTTLQFETGKQRLNCYFGELLPTARRYSTPTRASITPTTEEERILKSDISVCISGAIEKARRRSGKNSTEKSRFSWIPEVIIIDQQ